MYKEQRDLVLQTRDAARETLAIYERRLVIAKDLEEMDTQKREADLAAVNARIAAEAKAAIEQIKREQDVKDADARRDSARLNERHVARQVEMHDNDVMNRQTLNYLKQERKAQGGASEDDDEDDSDDERPKKRGRRGGGGCDGGSGRGGRGGRGDDNDPRGSGHPNFSSVHGHYNCSGW